MSEGCNIVICTASEVISVDTVCSAPYVRLHPGSFSKESKKSYCQTFVFEVELYNNVEAGDFIFKSEKSCSKQTPFQNHESDLSLNSNIVVCEYATSCTLCVQCEFRKSFKDENCWSSETRKLFLGAGCAKSTFSMSHYSEKEICQN